VVPGEKSTLFQCKDESLTIAQVCPGGCQPNGTGVDDQCLPPQDGGLDGTADSTSGGGGGGGDFTP
jgi:hypothetical protein